MTPSNAPSPRAITKRTQRWFAESVEVAMAGIGALTEYQRAALVRWFAADVARYVRWQPHPTFTPRQLDTGAFVIEWPLVHGDLAHGISESRADAAREALRDEATQFPTLDAWLMAEARGELVAVRLQGGSAGLPEAQRAALAQSAAARQRRWFATCRVCGDTFRPSRRDAQRCPSCCASGKRIV
jgi:hypothetical protein